MRAGFSRPVAVACLAACLGGCAGYTPPLSLYKLSQVDMLRTDPSAFRAAVQLPAGLVPFPEGARVIVGRNANAQLAARTEELLLQPVVDADATHALASEMRRDTRIFVFRLGERDAERLRDFQQEMRALERRGIKPGGKLEVKASACHVTGARPAAAIKITTYVRFAATGAFIPLVRDLDISRELGSAAATYGACRGSPPAPAAAKH